MKNLHHHTHNPKPNQCAGTVVQKVNAPLPLVWSILRRFDEPQAYKMFVRNCTVLAGGGGGVGSVREVELVSGFPGSVGRERLDLLDDDMHVMVYTMIDGDQRLENYVSTTTAQEAEGGAGGTMVVESYVVDVPEGNTEEETRDFVNSILGFNLKSLASAAESFVICHFDGSEDLNNAIYSDHASLLQKLNDSLNCKDESNSSETECEEEDSYSYWDSLNSRSLTETWSDSNPKPSGNLCVDKQTGEFMMSRFLPIGEESRLHRNAVSGRDHTEWETIMKTSDVQHDHPARYLEELIPPHSSYRQSKS